MTTRSKWAPIKAVASVPPDVFKGHNFMTPNVIGLYSGRQAGRTVYVELASGRGIEHEPIFGVTVRGAGGRRLEPDPSKLFWSRRKAQAYIDAGLKPEADDA